MNINWGNTFQTSTPKLTRGLESSRRYREDVKLTMRADEEKRQAVKDAELGAISRRRRDRRELNGMNIYEPHQGKRECERRRTRSW